MKKYIGFLCLITILMATIISGRAAFARPISYPGGTMLMIQNDAARNAASFDYTITPTIAFGLRSEYERMDGYQLHALTMNNRLWRGNYPEAQSNLYLLSGIGYAFDNGSDDTSPAAFTGIEADWENRRFFTSYENKFTYAGDVDKKFSQSARVGVAPYVAEYNSLHTWLMLQVDHRPRDDDKFTATPLVRLFTGPHLVEAGMSNTGTVLFNYTHQF